MNAKHEQSAEKKALVDSLLAIDSRTPTSAAEVREVATKVLRRDRRRVRILTWMTIGSFLLTVLGIGGGVYWYYMKVVPTMNWHQRIMSELSPQLSNKEPLGSAILTTAAACQILYKIQLANLWGIMALFTAMLAAACCTVLLIMASRRATLRQIQTSLLALSEQFDTLQRSLDGGKSNGGGQATQESRA